MVIKYTHYGVGVMKGKEMKLEDVKVSYILLVKFLDIDSMGRCGCVCYSGIVRYTIDTWSCQNRHKSWGWSAKKIKGPECK